jgi:hypothetical protein
MKHRSQSNQNKRALAENGRKEIVEPRYGILGIRLIGALPCHSFIYKTSYERSFFERETAAGDLQSRRDNHIH